MACDTSFSDCVADPIRDMNLTAGTNFGSLSNTLTFSVNVVLYILYAVLIVFVGYSFFRAIYMFFAWDSAETVEKFWQGFWSAVLAAFGIVLILGARFILVNVLKLLGIPEAENIFMGNQIFKVP